MTAINPFAEQDYEVAHLVLQDGTVFVGEPIGAAIGPDTAFSGEVVFNTAMSGYQEIITDPSYAGQVIAFTYPHIGNYGVTELDDEARKPFCRGIVVRELCRAPSNWRADTSLPELLVRHGIPGITGVDTRRLTRHVREAGAMACAFGTAELSMLQALATAERGTTGADLVSEVTTDVAYRREGGPLQVVAYDFGIKTTILNKLSAIASVLVVPAHTSAAEVLCEKPDGVFFSNGPGDPAALGPIVAEIKNLIGEVPIFGICLGHQLLASAFGASTYKLAFGHHGANHPVKALGSGIVEVTSQNHSYAVSGDTLKGAEVTHINLNDGVLEGFSVRDQRAFAVQYHPEAGPGPHDASYLFEEFRELMEASR